VIHLVVSGSNCEGLVGAALRVPSYPASPLAPQVSPGENQSMLPDPELPPSATNHFRCGPDNLDNRGLGQ
jgi:hypothetical protein